MTKIKVLPENVINKIAAGEVIERPASVLKELLENSMDAGAGTINIDLETAGKKLIRVHDNGTGLSEKDLELAVKRHSTSKISNFEDLDSLTTFGFRGEALYSIAAISKLNIKSSLHNAESGSQIYLEGAKLVKKSSAAAIGGTTVEVKDLFFNTPARKKFLKSDSTERSHLIKVIEEAALTNPKIAFNVKSAGKEIYCLPKQSSDEKTNLFNRIKSILGKDIASKLSYVSDADLGCRAFIGTVGRFTTSKNMQFFFVNKRPVTSAILRQSMYRALANYTDKNSRIVSVVYIPKKKKSVLPMKV
jgi:DNA mismatch repair protein MutL